SAPNTPVMPVTPVTPAAPVMPVTPAAPVMPVTPAAPPSAEIGAELTQLAFPTAGGQIVFALPKSAPKLPPTPDTPGPASTTPPPLPSVREGDTPSRTAIDTRRAPARSNPDALSSTTPTSPASPPSPSPTSPTRTSSPAQLEDPAMAKLIVNDP